MQPVQVTWKADGTRYLLLLCMWGTYLVDRSFHVRRVQMRYPLNAEKGHHRSLPVPATATPAAAQWHGELAWSKCLHSGQYSRTAQMVA